MRAAGWMMLAVGLLAGCEESPAEGFDAFLQAAYEQDVEAAWERFDDTSRARMEELAAIGATGGKDPKAHLLSVFGVVMFESIDVIDEDGNKARLRIVPSEGDARVVDMVKERGLWRIALLPARTGG